MNGAEIPRPPFHRITIVQLVLLVPSCLALAVGDRVLAYSALFGGLIAIVPQAWFAHVAFRRRGASAAAAVARNGYAGEVGKFLLSAVGFALVFATVRPVNGSAVLGAFMLAQVVQIVGSWLLLTRS